jgi:hypothetical protein
MTNAKAEFVEETEGKQVLCATITYGRAYWSADRIGSYVLRVGYTPEELDSFLQGLDFEYDSGFGGQELHGTIWYSDGTWSSRGEYDGQEWWEYNVCPPVSEECTPPSDPAPHI